MSDALSSLLFIFGCGVIGFGLSVWRWSQLDRDPWFNELQGFCLLMSISASFLLLGSGTVGLILYGLLWWIG